MLFAPLLASFCALASVTSAAPVASSEDKRTFGLNLGTSKITELQKIVTTVESKAVPVLYEIQGLVSSNEGCDALLAGISVDVDVDACVGCVSLAPLTSLVHGLKGLISTDQVNYIASTLTDLGSCSPELYSLIHKLLVVIGYVSTSKSQIEHLIASYGTNGILAALTNTHTLVAKLSSLISTIFLTLNLLSVQLAAAIARSSHDVTKLNAAIQALRAPLDTSTASIIYGANSIVSGLTVLIVAALNLLSSLKHLTTVNGTASSLLELCLALDLHSIKSALWL